MRGGLDRGEERVGERAGAAERVRPPPRDLGGEGGRAGGGISGAREEPRGEVVVSELGDCRRRRVREAERALSPRRTRVGGVGERERGASAIRVERESPARAADVAGTQREEPVEGSEGELGLAGVRRELGEVVPQNDRVGRVDPGERGVEELRTERDSFAEGAAEVEEAREERAGEAEVVPGERVGAARAAEGRVGLSRAERQRRRLAQRCRCLRGLVAVALTLPKGATGERLERRRRRGEPRALAESRVLVRERAVRRERPERLREPGIRAARLAERLQDARAREEPQAGEIGLERGEVAEEVGDGGEIPGGLGRLAAGLDRAGVPRREPTRLLGARPRERGVTRSERQDGVAEERRRPCAGGQERHERDEGLSLTGGVASAAREPRERLQREACGLALRPLRQRVAERLLATRDARREGGEPCLGEALGRAGLAAITTRGGPREERLRGLGGRSGGRGERRAQLERVVVEGRPLGGGAQRDERAGGVPHAGEQARPCDERGAGLGGGELRVRGEPPEDLGALGGRHVLGARRLRERAQGAERARIARERLSREESRPAGIFRGERVGEVEPDLDRVRARRERQPAGQGSSEVGGGARGALQRGEPREGAVVLRRELGAGGEVAPRRGRVSGGLRAARGEREQRCPRRAVERARCERRLRVGERRARVQVRAGGSAPRARVRERRVALERDVERRRIRRQVVRAEREARALGARREPREPEQRGAGAGPISVRLSQPGEPCERGGRGRRILRRALERGALAAGRAGAGVEVRRLEEAAEPLEQHGARRVVPGPVQDGASELGRAGSAQLEGALRVRACSSRVSGRERGAGGPHLEVRRVGGRAGEERPQAPERERRVPGQLGVIGLRAEHRSVPGRGGAGLGERRAGPGGIHRPEQASPVEPGGGGAWRISGRGRDRGALREERGDERQILSAARQGEERVEASGAGVRGARSGGGAQRPDEIARALARAGEPVVQAGGLGRGGRERREAAERLALRGGVASGGGEPGEPVERRAAALVRGERCREPAPRVCGAPQRRRGLPRASEDARALGPGGQEWREPVESGERAVLPTRCRVQRGEPPEEVGTLGSERRGGLEVGGGRRRIREARLGDVGERDARSDEELGRARGRRWESGDDGGVVLGSLRPLAGRLRGAGGARVRLGRRRELAGLAMAEERVLRVKEPLLPERPGLRRGGRGRCPISARELRGAEPLEHAHRPERLLGGAARASERGERVGILRREAERMIEVEARGGRVRLEEQRSELGVGARLLGVLGIMGDEAPERAQEALAVARGRRVGAERPERGDVIAAHRQRELRGTHRLLARGARQREDRLGRRERREGLAPNRRRLPRARRAPARPSRAPRARAGSRPRRRARAGSRGGARATRRRDRAPRRGSGPPRRAARGAARPRTGARSRRRPPRGTPRERRRRRPRRAAPPARGTCALPPRRRGGPGSGETAAGPAAPRSHASRTTPSAISARASGTPTMRGSFQPRGARMRRSRKGTGSRGRASAPSASTTLRARWGRSAAGIGAGP